jgi:hypothetical protein
MHAIGHCQTGHANIGGRVTRFADERVASWTHQLENRDIGKEVFRLVAPFRSCSPLLRAIGGALSRCSLGFTSGFQNDWLDADGHSGRVAFLAILHHQALHSLAKERRTSPASDRSCLHPLRVNNIGKLGWERDFRATESAFEIGSTH